ncbi:MAG: DUF4252 domain-containing protein, partial [Acidobacteria bacterium]|nr:DUF4252 domain-containing protein [Acidobacteriota bacterium]
AARAQTPTVVVAGRVQIDSLNRLASKAAESANVNLSEQLLKIVPPILSKDDPEEKNIGEMIAGLRGIYVRHYEFDAEGAYAESDIAPIHAQLSGAGWSRIVEVHSRREGVKNVEVYLATTGSRVDGLVVIAAEPKQLTVVNIVGSVDLEKLRKLEGNFGVPDLEIERDEKPAPKKQSAGTPKKKP